MAFDNICKFLSEKYPNEFAAWILGYPIGTVQVLKTELSNEPVRADSLTLLQTSDRILHLEFQVETACDPPLPFRMLDYWVRLYRRYRLMIVQVVVLLKESPTALILPDEFQYCKTRHGYQIIRLWEQDTSAFLENPALLPLAPLTHTESPLKLLKQVAVEIDKIDNIDEKRQILTCTQILSGLRCDKEWIYKIFREDIMRESVIYQDIIQRGIEQGLERGRIEGIQEGRQEGRQEGERILIQRMLERRFGFMDSNARESLERLSLSQLEELGEALLDFKEKTDLLNWLRGRSV